MDVEEILKKVETTKDSIEKGDENLISVDLQSNHSLREKPQNESTDDFAVNANMTSKIVPRFVLNFL